MPICRLTFISTLVPVHRVDDRRRGLCCTLSYLGVRRAGWEGVGAAGESVSYVSEVLPAEHVASALAGAGFALDRPRSVERTLLDTFDGRLHAAGIRMEVRTGAGTTVIVSGGGPAPAYLLVDQVPTLAGDLPAGPLRARLAPVLDVRALRPTVRVTARHIEAMRRDQSGKAVVGVGLYDQLRLDSTDEISVAWVAEVIPFEGYARAARQTEDLLVSLGLSCRQGDLLDVAAADAGIDLRGFVDSPTVTLDPADAAGGGFRRVLANLAATIDANWQGTVDDVDPEFLHDLRVAVRRTRSILSHGKHVLPADGRDHFRGEFRWLGTVTSPARDMDVYMIEWPDYVEPLDPQTARDLAPVVDHIAGRRAAEHAVLVGHLESAHYQGLMTAWRAWLDEPGGDGKSAKKSKRPLGPVVAAHIGEAQDQLLHRGRGISPGTAAEELHELRKDAKRLRYLLECFGGMLPAAARKPFVQRLKALQDNLGEHQDTEVHTAQLVAMSEELHGFPGVTAATLMAMGRLTEVFERRRLAARSEFAARFGSYDTKQTAQALADLVGAIA
jgi:CHAD domain-containing protein